MKSKTHFIITKYNQVLINQYSNYLYWLYQEYVFNDIYLI